MNRTESLNAAVAPLNTLLIDHFGAREPEFPAKARTLRDQLPHESANLLAEAAERFEQLQRQEPPETGSLGEFAFLCGRVYENLNAYRQLQWEETLVKETGNGAAEPLQDQQADRLARFIEYRDRIFRQVADFTLKALLAMLGLFLVGMVLGLI
jgi:hypothetical protein